MGTLTTADTMSFARACLSVYRMRRAIEELEKDGDVIDGRRNPWALVLREETQALDKFGAKFGWSPADRARIKTQKPDTGDALDVFLGKAG